MDIVHLPETREDTSTNAGTTETPSVSEVDQPRVSKGGDATDILPDEILKTRIQSRERFTQDDACSMVAVRGEFAQLQRELEARIEQFDRTCDVCYEDSEVIIYRLDKQKDYEYILDYCEVENTRLREMLVEVIRAIAADRTDEVGRYPLVIRKPHMFRSGERHVLQLLRSKNHPTDPSK
ncbi:hypothetical protein [Natronomonas amylolytica]|uniref:hypothetical protein n=1 Tax=Natronomonas amylolytica TaxID=3108498 RepID=UPI00300BEFB4